MIPAVDQDLLVLGHAESVVQPEKLRWFIRVPPLGHRSGIVQSISVIYFLDTNILLYSISRAPDEVSKRERAISLLDEDGGALSVQVLQEFYVQTTRPTRSDPLPHEIATGLMRAWMRFPVQDITVSILSQALDLKSNHGFSYWDSAIIAAARALGCRELYSEDMAHGREVEGVLILDPFRS